MKLLGNLYRHGISAGLYEEWIRRDKDERKKVLWRWHRYGLRMDYAAHAVGDIKDEALRAGLLHRALSLGPFHRRPPILVFVGQDKGTCFEAGIRAWLVTDFDVDVVTGPSDAGHLVLQNMYDSEP
jgi:hypothetical protein